MTGILIPHDTGKFIQAVELPGTDLATLMLWLDGPVELAELFKPEPALLAAIEEGEALGRPFNQRSTGLLYLLIPDLPDTFVVSGDSLIIGKDSESVPDIFVQFLVGDA